MAFTFDAKIALALDLDPRGGIIAFIVYPVKSDPEDEENVVRCADEEAEVWAIYANVNRRDGLGDVEDWVADLETKEAADTLCYMFNTIAQAQVLRETGKEIIHPDLEQIIHDNLLAGGTVYYSVEQISNTPESFQLTIDLGEDESEELMYDMKYEPDQDIAVASKIFNITFIDKNSGVTA